MLVKTVIFLTFWQGLACSLSVSAGLIEYDVDAKAVQNFLISVEMIFASVMLLFAFPYRVRASCGSLCSDYCLFNEMADF